LQENLDKAREFQQISGTEATLASGQRDDGVLRREIGPAKWNLALAALLVEEAHPVLATVFFLSEDLKLTTSERVKGMRDPKLLWFYSTNACSATPLAITSGTRASLAFAKIRSRRM
jgi:hypothetical protein